MNTNSYIFFTGHFSLLSYAELEACFGSTMGVMDRDFVLMDLPQPFTQKDLYSLGGIIKVAEVTHRWNAREATEESLAADIVRDMLLPIAGDGKLRYAINCYGKHTPSLSKLLNYTKKQAKKEGHSVRFVNKNLQKNISSVVISKERLIEKGIDISLCVKDGVIYGARTVASQDFASYGQRDFDKPVRDMEGGIMPPKLAQMMLNIAMGKDKSNKVIWDPFCGSGTLIMEGMLQQAKMIGTDIDPMAIAKAEENVHWLEGHYGFRQPRTPSLFVHNATNPPEQIPNVDAVVSETYLGPTVKKLPKPGEQHTILQEVLALYEEFLSRIPSTLNPGARIVLTIPFFNNDGRYERMQRFPSMVKELGYTMVSMVSDNVYQQLGLRKDPRNSLLYVRREHMVGREVVCLIRQ